MPTFRDINQFNAVADAEVNPDWTLQVSATQRVTLRQIADTYTPKSLTIKVGETSKSYNTKTEVSVDINPSSIGAANKNHNHSTTDILSPGKLTLSPPLIDGDNLLQPIIEHSNLSNTTKSLSLTKELGIFCKTRKFASLLNGNVDIWLTTKIDLHGIHFIFQFKLLNDVTFEESLGGYSTKISYTSWVTLVSLYLEHTTDSADLPIFLGDYSQESPEYKYLKYIESKLCKRSKMSDRTSISPLVYLTTLTSDIVKGCAYIHLRPDNIIDFDDTDKSFLAIEAGIHINSGVNHLDKAETEGLTLFNQLQLFIPFEDIGITISE